MKNFLIKYKFPLSLIFYEIVISARIFFEMGLCPLHTFIHQLTWFNTVLLIFVMCFKMILKVKLEKLWILAFGGLLTFIPLIVSDLANHEWALNYIEPASLIQLLKDLITLLFFHDYNWPMFPELFLLLTGSLGLAYYLSKNIKRSVLCAFAAFYGSFLLLGFSWIAVNPEHPTLFLLKSSFSESKFYSLQVLTYFILFLSLTNFKNTVKYFRNIKDLSFHITNFMTIVVFYSLIIYLTGEPLTIADNIVTAIPILFIAYTIRTFRFSKMTDAVQITFVLTSILSIIAMLTKSNI